MVRYKATISYDGTLFSGFQRQPNARSIQEEIEKTLLRLNSGTPVTVHGAGLNRCWCSCLWTGYPL